MKNKIIGLALIAAFTLASGSEVEAARRYKPRRARMFQRSSGDNFFGRVMELERRKNAWLRATFLGR